MGYSPDLVVGVFVGFDDNRSLGENETGAVDAVPIFVDFMQQALKGTPVVDFKAPRDGQDRPHRRARGGVPSGRRAAPASRTFAPGLRQQTSAPWRPGPGGSPIPYTELVGPRAPARGPRRQPPPTKAPSDLNGLY